MGNARTYLLAWLSIRSRGGRLILRMEDIDSPRVKPGAAAQALDDLRWLGLNWDEGPDVGGPNGPYVQTERLDTYLDAIESLRRDGRIYPCVCTRTDIASAASAPHAGQEGPIYPGTCRDKPHGEATHRNEAPFAWRFRASGDEQHIDDRIAGRSTCRVAAELGDFVVARSNGFPAYQLAVVVDDHRMGVTEVVRGDDLLPSAFRQLELYAAFGWTPPSYAHTPLVVGPDGRRLAKRHGDTRISVLRESGGGPERLLGLLAHSCGLRPTDEPTTAAALLGDFDFARLPRQPFVFTEPMWNGLREY